MTEVRSRWPALPPVQYLSGPDGRAIAYTSQGRGPALVLVPNIQLNHLAAEWDVPGAPEWFQTIARRHRLVRFDPAGSGLSRETASDFSIASLSGDIGSVLDALAIERAAVMGFLTGGLPAVHFAATRSDRVSHLVLWDSFARNVDHGAAPRLRSLFAMAATDWELFTESISQAALGWRDAEGARRWAAVIRAGSSPEPFQRYIEARASWDVSGMLAQVQAKTLVLHDPANPLASEERCRELAAGITGARMVTAGSRSGLPDLDAARLIEEFLRDGPLVAGRGDGELTPRELDVLRAVARGATNAEVANGLSISINTVTRHLSHIYGKTGTRNRVEAIRYGEQLGLVD